MPELPEIETVKLQLQKVLPGKIIRKIEVLKPKSFQGNPKLVEGKKVLKVGRIAKLLLVDMEGPADLAIHFKMTGQLVWVRSTHNSHLTTHNSKKITSDSQLTTQDRIAGGHPTGDFTGDLPSKHTRVVFHLAENKTSPPTPLLTSGEGSESTLYFNDQRIFGWIKVGNKDEIANMKFIRELGPEPFDIDANQFAEIFMKIKKPIKLALMDQTKISGVGNIYANDACWEAKVNPRRGANTLTRKQYQDLFDGVIKVLREGIKFGGATAADAKYIDLHGLGGHYQDHFRVYDREGEECLREDGGIIHKFSLGGRGTYLCPKCQK